MTTAHVPEPELPDGITPAELDAEARRDLRGLQKDTADIVAKHLVAAGMLVDEDPERALEHARFARRRASRIAVVREAAGIAAYHAGEWNEALGELRAARRMGGGPGHLAVMADIERALGRPERALELVRAPEAKELGRAETIELAIVAAGARRDLGELDAAVVGLQIPELEPTRREPWSPRLFYAYADNLLAAGRESDALQWFVHTVDADPLGETDAAERIADLTGEPLDNDGVEFQGEDEVDSADADLDHDADSDAEAGVDDSAEEDAAAEDSGEADAPDVADRTELADVSDPTTDLGRTDLGRTDLDQTDLEQADLDGADAETADVDSAGLDGAHLGTADPDGADSDVVTTVDAPGVSTEPVSSDDPSPGSAVSGSAVTVDDAAEAGTDTGESGR